MQINKKIYSTLIISLLTLSMIAIAIPMVSALDGPPALFATPFGPGVPTTVKTTGNVGDRISVLANATDGTPAAAFTTVTAYWDSLSGIMLGTTSADVNGHYRIDVVIPSAVTGAHFIIVKDSGDANYTTFTVEPKVTAATVPPAPGPVRVLPGDSLTVTGHGYAAGDEMTLSLVADGLNTVAITTPVVETNSTGSFTATIVIPAIAVANYSLYNVTAADEVPSTAVFEISIDYYMILAPNSGPTGITTIISGRIPASKAYEIRFNAAPIATGTSSATGDYSESYTIPSVLSTGQYQVMIVWDTSLNRTANFTVNAPPTITLGATAGVAGTVVTIDGSTFSKYATITLYFGTTVVNSTATDSRFGPTNAFTGNFAEEFVVPALAPGVYAVKVVDQYGASTQPIYTFTINPTPVTTVALNGATYSQGDALSFTFYTTETSILGGPACVIRSPAGIVFWSTKITDWTLTTIGVTQRALYQDQLFSGSQAVLPADAPLGTWNWTITYTPVSTGLSTKATGLFTVTAPATLDSIMTKLDDVQGNITDAITTSEGVIIDSLDGLDAQLTSISSNVASISTTVGTINTAVSNLNIGTLGSDVMAIADDVATIITDLGTLTANVDDIGLEVTEINDGVATIETDLGTLSGTVTSIDDGVATIETEVGTVKADVQGLSEVDMTPVWIAVVLSLIAAIAAVFAVITIRSKIAG
jgi:archaellum component FlaC